MITVARNQMLDEACPLGITKGCKVGLADLFKEAAACLAAFDHCGLFIAAGVDHALPPVTEFLADTAAKIFPAFVPAGIGNPVVRDEPAETTGFAVADGAEPWVGVWHVSNLALVISV